MFVVLAAHPGCAFSLHAEKRRMATWGIYMFPPLGVPESFYVIFFCSRCLLFLSFFLCCYLYSRCVCRKMVNCADCCWLAAVEHSKLVFKDDGKTKVVPEHFSCCWWWFGSFLLSSLFCALFAFCKEEASGRAESLLFCF